MIRAESLIAHRRAMSTTSKLTSASSSAKMATITWTIDNFVNKKIHQLSPAFVFPNNKKTAFQLYIDPKIQLGHVAVYLSLLRCDKSELSVRYRLSILDAKKQKCKEQVNEVTFSATKLLRRFQALDVDRDYLLNNENGLLVDGKVTLHCEVEMIEEKEVSSDYEEVHKTCQDYEAFFKSGKFTDVVLKIGEQELKAHKSFLMARSPVFAAMFDDDCKKEDNIIEITDVSVDVFKELLRFIYCGKTRDLHQFAPELLAAADWYQMDCLKSLCARYLASKLNDESVVETLLLADLHQAAELKAKCIEFINSKHGPRVMATDGWKRLIATNCKDLVVELFQDLQTKNQERFKEQVYQQANTESVEGRGAPSEDATPRTRDRVSDPLFGQQCY